MRSAVLDTIATQCPGGTHMLRTRQAMSNETYPGFECRHAGFTGLGGTSQGAAKGVEMAFLREF